jgi:homoserine kinase type II
VAVYTDIAEEELEAFLADYDIGRPLSFKGIAEGVENSNFVLETPSGRFILTLYERRVDPADLPFFLGLMSWLANAGFPCALPVADRAGHALKRLNGRPAALVTFLRGLSPKHPTTAQCREAGRGLAWLHEAAEGFPGRRSNGLGQASWAGLFAPLAAAADGLQDGLAAVIARDLEAVAQAWPSDLPEGVIHADFFPDNVFFLSGRFAGAIDFYFAAWDMRAYDLAVALNAWCFEADGAFDPARARALLSGYQGRRPLTQAELAALPVLARGAALRFFITRLADWGATPPGSLVKPKDPLEYARRLTAHRHGLPLASLAS